MELNITNLDDLKTFITENGEKEELKGILPVKEAELSIDKIQGYLNEKDEGKNFLQSVKDKHFSQSLETWKANNLDKTVEEEIARRYPGETPEQKEIRKLKQEIESERQNRLKTELKIQAKEIAKEEELPFSLVDYFLGNDTDTTKENLKVLKTEFNRAVEEAVKKQLGGEGYTPDKGGKSSGFTYEDVLKMSQTDLAANWEKVKHFF